MASQTVAELFDHVEEFMSLLGTAEMNASGVWDEEFTADMRANFKRYGVHTYLSTAQLDQLERIANQ